MAEPKYSQKVERNFILIVAIVFLILTAIVIKDIFSIIVISIILSYFLNPLYNFYFRKTNNKKISAILTLTSFTLVVFIPLILMSYFLVLNLIKLVVQYKVYLENPDLLNQIILQFSQNFTNSSILGSIDTASIIKSVVLFIVDLSGSFFSSIPKAIISFFITLFLSYYLLLYNKEIFNAINEFIPMTLKRQNLLLANIAINLKTIFKGYFLTGLAQTAVAIIGYLIFGAPNVLILAFLTLVASLIPYIGTPIIWVPVSFYLIITGHPISGIGLLIFGALVISTLDNFLRPILMSNKDTIAPPLVFVGLIGGMIAFGIIGIIIGPIIISITSILLKYVKETFENQTQ